jgi:hypothetical protein
MRKYLDDIHAQKEAQLLFIILLDQIVQDLLQNLNHNGRWFIRDIGFWQFHEILQYFPVDEPHKFLVAVVQQFLERLGYLGQTVQLFKMRDPLDNHVVQVIYNYAIVHAVYLVDALHNQMPHMDHGFNVCFGDKVLFAQGLGQKVGSKGDMEHGISNKSAVYCSSAVAKSVGQKLHYPFDRLQIGVSTPIVDGNEKLMYGPLVYSLVVVVGFFKVAKFVSDSFEHQ